MNTDPRFPVGKFKMPEMITSEDRKSMIAILGDLPAALKMAVEGLSIEQLLVPYREGGWCSAQVVNHIADSHMNAFIRFKLALTEVNPTIKPYEEALWAELPDGKDTDLSGSLQLIEGLHKRFVKLLENMNEGDWQRTFFHPANNRKMLLEGVLALYSWHSEHHLAHITQLRTRMDW
jgi:hypothetical protein